MSRVRLFAVPLVLATGLTMSGCTNPADGPPEFLVALINHSAPADDVSGTQFCAGVLVSPTEVLTAAHCVARKSADAIDAIVGADNLCNTAPIEVHRIRIDSVRLLPDLDGAIIELAAAAPETPAKLTEASPTDAGELAAWGWGKDSIGGVAPCTAQAKPLTRVLNDQCPDLAVSGSLDYFCAVPSEGRNTCEGDSGGPTVDASRHVIGITTSGVGCGPEDPGNYLLASSFGLG